MCSKRDARRDPLAPSWRVLGAILLAVAIAIPAAAAGGDGRFTVCSITINSDDEIQTFRKHLPPSEFRFVELTDHETAAAAGAETWFGRACASGVRCDVLVLSAHFGNTYAGNYGTTFAGRSGLSLPLEELEQRRCDESCPGILQDPLEVYLFGCKTLATPLGGESLSGADLALLARHGVSAEAAERIADEVRYGTEGTDTRSRMRFVFSAVPRVYGFTDVAPSGRQVAPLLDKYLASVDDYGAELRSLQAAAAPPNFALAGALATTCFAQTGAFAFGGPDLRREARTCLLASARRPLASRVDAIGPLLDDPGFVSYLPTIESMLRTVGPATFGAAEFAALQRLRAHSSHARAALAALLSGLEAPALRLEILRVELALGWMSGEEALPLQRAIALQLLRPPVWGEARSQICGLGRGVLDRTEIRADEVPPETYSNEFGIQALACLKPSDELIHERLARSLLDSREWIARLAAITLEAVKPQSVAVQIALAEQLARREEGPRAHAAEALRALKPSDPRVLAAIRRSAPSFAIDWL